MGMLLGLTGAAGSGKDTVADYLVAEHGFTRYAFADAVRDVALAIDPCVPLLMNPTGRLSEIVDAVGWDKAKRQYSEVRRLLQVIGTEAGRKVLGENCWVNIVMQKRFADGFPDSVITDMRFQNEFDMITNEQGVTARIERPDNPNAVKTNHVSEQGIFNCNYVILNDKDLDWLHYQADCIVKWAR